MKTTLLLYIGAMLFLISCAETPDAGIPQNLTIDEMKSRVEVEEISFENETSESVINLESKDSVRMREVEPRQIRRSGYRDLYPVPNYDLDQPLKVERPEPGPPTIPIPSHEMLPEDTVEDGVHFIAEIDAQFPGGIIEMKKFIASNLKYPDREVSYQGRVYVSFVVGQDGAIRDEKVFRGVSEDRDAEALRVIRAMPNWIPAENNGKIVAAKVRLPISFKSY